jgi:hypothetical protein
MDAVPQELRPTTTFPVRLITGENVLLPLCQTSFKSWLGPKPIFSFGGKPFLDHKDKPVFAELLILNLLREKGWDGVWVEEYGGRTKYLREMPINSSLEPSVDPPVEHKRLHDDIQKSVGKNGGCFDVMAWRDGQTIFLEAKRKRHDKIRDTQRRWIEAALLTGLASDKLIIVEWSPC